MRVLLLFNILVLRMSLRMKTIERASRAPFGFSIFVGFPVLLALFDPILWIAWVIRWRKNWPGFDWFAEITFSDFGNCYRLSFELLLANHDFLDFPRLLGWLPSSCDLILWWIASPDLVLILWPGFDQSLGQLQCQFFVLSSLCSMTAIAPHLSLVLLFSALWGIYPFKPSQINCVFDLAAAALGWHLGNNCWSHDAIMVWVLDHVFLSLDCLSSMPTTFLNLVFRNTWAASQLWYLNIQVGGYWYNRVFFIWAFYFFGKNLHSSFLSLWFSTPCSRCSSCLLKFMSTLFMNSIMKIWSSLYKSLSNENSSLE